MVVYNNSPKQQCSKCLSFEFHEFNSDEIETTTGYKLTHHWIQCNNCSHKKLLSTTTMATISFNSSNWVMEIPKEPEIIQF
jgi:hypothetical protein